MPDWAPQMPPELMQQALMRRPGVTLPQAQLPGPLPMTMPPQPGAPPPAAAPIRMGPGGVNLAPPGPPGVGASGIPSAPAPTGASIPPPSPTPPQPSDDPGISPEMRKALQSTQSAQAGIDTERQNVNTLMGQQPKAPSYEDYKPPLWKKIAAPFVGALAGREAGPAVSGMLYGPWNRAQDAYQTQEKGWQAKLGAEERVGVPLANDTARVAQESYTNTLNAKKEAETERKDQETEALRSQYNDIQDAFKNGTLDERHQRELDTIASRSDNLDLKQKALALQQQIVDMKKDQARDKADPTGWTPSESREISQRSRSMLTQINANAHMRAALVGSKDPQDIEQLAAIDKENADLHGQIDAVEKDVESRRTKPGSAAASPAASSTGGFQVPKGAPAPTKAGQDLKMNKKVVAHSVDGKSWGPPQ